MTSIHVRAAEPSDAEAIHAIISCRQVIAQTIQIPYQSQQKIREHFIDNSAADHRLVAELDGSVIGVLGLVVQKRPRLRHSGAFGMSVHDDYQNRGVGRALMTAMIDLADNWLDLRRLALEVYADNQAAIHLYESFGFVTEGRMRDFAFRDGQYVDALLMARIRA